MTFFLLFLLALGLAGLPVGLMLLINQCPVLGFVLTAGVVAGLFSWMRRD